MSSYWLVAEERVGSDFGGASFVTLLKFLSLGTKEVRGENSLPIVQ